MKVLFVNPTGDLYGASRCLLRLIRSLDRDCYEPIVVVPEDGPLCSELRQDGICVHVMPYLSVVRRRVLRTWRIVPFMISIVPSVLSLFWLIRRRHIDLLHTNTGVIFVAALASRLAGKSHIWHLREMFAEEFGALWRAYKPVMLCLSRKVLCVSTPIAQQFGTHDKVETVYDGLDTVEFRVPPCERQSWRDRLCQGSRSYLVGMVGRISIRKGPFVFLEAAGRLKSQGRADVRYVIVGDAFAGNEYLVDQLMDVVRAQGLEDDVVFTGYLQDSSSLIAACDILVVPSLLPEAFPGIVLEAMALGVPVIATNIGGTIEQIEDGVSGLLVPPGDALALANAISHMLDDPLLRSKMGKAGAVRVGTLFSLDALRDRVAALYQELGR